MFFKCLFLQKGIGLIAEMGDLEQGFYKMDILFGAGNS